MRELENLIERALLLCPPDEQISPEDFFDRVPQATAPVGAGNGTLESAVLRFERATIQEALAACEGNKTHAARRLGLTYRGPLLKMKRNGMSAGA